MNSLSLTPVVIYQATLQKKNRYLQVLRNTVELNSFLGLFARFFSFTYKQCQGRQLFAKTI